MVIDHESKCFMEKLFTGTFQSGRNMFLNELELFYENEGIKINNILNFKI